MEDLSGKIREFKEYIGIGDIFYYLGIQVIVSRFGTYQLEARYLNKKGNIKLLLINYEELPALKKEIARQEEYIKDMRRQEKY